MSYMLTGGDGTAPAQIKPMGQRIDYNAGDSQMPSAWRPVDQYNVSPGPLASEGQAVPARRAAGAKKADPRAKLRRDVMRRKILHAKEEADGMMTAAEGGDQTRVSNLIYKLRDTLQDLWQLRNDREDDWGDILNTLQIALEYDEIGELTVSQCKAIKDVIEDHLALHSVDSSNLEECVLALVSCGLDPFQGSAQDGAESENPTTEGDQ